MALSQEEIRIRAGLDYSKVTAGLTDIRKQVYKLAGDVPKQLGNILKANVFGAAATLISEALPSWDEIWSRVYGYDENQLRQMEETGDRLRKLRDMVKDAQKQAGNTAKEQDFEKGNDRQKLEMLKSDATLSRQRTESVLKQLKYAKEYNFDLEKRKELEIEYNNALDEQWKAEDKLAKFTKKLSPETLNDLFRQMQQENVSTVQKARSDLQAANATLAEDPTSIAAQDLRNKAIGQINQSVEAMTATRLGAVGQSMQSLPFIGNSMATLLQQAQRQAMEEVVQKVKIVEVE